MSNFVAPDQVMLLERPLLKVPYEQVRRTLRTSQRVIEREMSQLNQTCDRAKNVRKSGQQINTPAANSTKSRDSSIPLSAIPPISENEAGSSDSPAMDVDISQTTSSELNGKIAEHSVSLGTPNNRKRSAPDTPATSEKTTPNDDKELVSDMLNRARALKSKLEDSAMQNRTVLSQSKRRLEFLQALYKLPPHTSLVSPAYSEWSHQRLYVHIVDYLLRSGYVEVAEAIAKDQGIEALVDVEFWKDCHRIEKALVNHRVTEALTWCRENQSTLKKMKSTLEFSLRMQEFIELTRARKHQEAITYSRRWLMPWSLTHISQIKQAMGLLAFGADTECPPYKAMFSNDRWEDLVQEFRSTVFELHSLLPIPPLLLSMYTGLSALKSSSCYEDQGDEVHDECPTCDDEGLGLLASGKPSDGGVPWSHHTNTTLVCKISGKVMEGENQPMALPNGRVYSMQALQDMAISLNGKVRCPRTGDVYDFEEIRKISLGLSNPEPFEVMRIYKSPYPSSPSLPVSSVWDFVWSNPNNAPDGKVAVIDGTNGESWSRGYLRHSARSLAHGLRHKLHLQPGDVVSLFSPNSIHYFTILLACQCAGLVVSTANAAYVTGELKHQLKDSGAKYAFVHPDLLPVATEAAKGLGWDASARFGLAVRRSDAQKEVLGKYIPYDHLYDDNEVLEPTPIKDPKNSIAYLGYSSGTSGPAKGVMTSHYAMTSVLSSLGPFDVDKDSIQAAVLPLSHIYALTKVLHWSVLEGNTVVVFPKFQLDTFCAAVQRFKITVCMLVPPIALLLARDPSVDRYDLSSLKLIVSGAAPLGKELEEELSRRLRVGVGQAYGLTEMSPTTHYCPLAHPMPGSTGFLLPNMESRIVDPVTLEDVEEGQEGEMWLRGPNIMTAYLNRPDATKETIVEDGWLRTGDVAIVKNDYFFITDRLKELIKYKGFQVPPAELEALLLTHPKVKDSCVIGIYDPDQVTELPRAYVVLKDPADSKDPKSIEKEIQDFIKKNAAPSKQLRGGVEIIEEVPKSASGKILRRIIRDKAKRDAEKRGTIRESKL